MKQCWICKSPANTGEHLTKASDFQLFFPNVSQKNPVFLHNKSETNRLIRSKKSKFLKSKALICNRCNSSLSQPYDFAWEKLSKFIFESRKEISKSRKIKLKKLFPGRSRRSATDIQLYFLKLFGCLIYETDATGLLNNFSQHLLRRKAHPNVELFFYHTKDWSSVGISDLEVTYDRALGCVALAQWIYSVGNFSIKVCYLHPENEHLARRRGWHPERDHGVIKIFEL